METMDQTDTNPRTNAKHADRYGFVQVLRRMAGFRREKRGVAAVEFALIAPVMIALWLGSIELSQGVSIDRKVSLASSALADLVTQQGNITQAEMDNIMDATLAIMAPYDVSNLSIEIAGVSMDANSATRVEWSATRGGSAPVVGSAYAIPAPIVQPDSFLVVANLSYAHTPATTQALTGTIHLTDDFFLRPRRTDTITFTP